MCDQLVVVSALTLSEVRSTLPASVRAEVELRLPLSPASLIARTLADTREGDVWPVEGATVRVTR